MSGLPKDLYLRSIIDKFGGDIVIKSIKNDQVSEVPLEKVRPGMMILEGLVLETERTEGIYRFRVPLGYVETVPAQRTIQVYCRLASDAMVEGVLEAVEKQQYKLI